MRKIYVTVGIILFISAIIWAIFIPISNPDMTKTRLFLEYWPEYIAIFIMALVGAWLAAGFNEKK